MCMFRTEPPRDVQAHCLESSQLSSRRTRTSIRNKSYVYLCHCAHLYLLLYVPLLLFPNSSGALALPFLETLQSTWSSMQNRAQVENWRRLDPLQKVEWIRQHTEGGREEGICSGRVWMTFEAPPPASWGTESAGAGREREIEKVRQRHFFPTQTIGARGGSNLHQLGEGESNFPIILPLSFPFFPPSQSQTDGCEQGARTHIRHSNLARLLFRSLQAMS